MFHFSEKISSEPFPQQIQLNGQSLNVIQMPPNLLNGLNVRTNFSSNSGLLSDPRIVKISPGSRANSLRFFLQYGSKSHQFLMRLRSCSSSAIILRCEHYTNKNRSKIPKCDGMVKIIVLNPKILKIKKNVLAKRVWKKGHIVYLFNYDYPDTRNIKNYGEVTAIKPHTCTDNQESKSQKSNFQKSNETLSTPLKN